MNTKKRYKYIYGPVYSWRLGKSLGLDPVYTGFAKKCSFNCVYCQAGKTHFLTNKRQAFIPTKKIIEELKQIPNLKIDYITFSGAGEPTLAANLGDIIKGIRKIRKEKIAVLTNSSVIGLESVQKDLLLTDFVIAKLDAHSEKVFKGINKPAWGVSLKDVVEGLKSFRAKFKGRFALQIMFVSRNKKYAKKIANLALKIRPDEIEINTPLRPSPVKPLSRAEIADIKKQFSECLKNGISVTGIYDIEKKKINPLSRKNTITRRGKV